MEQIINQYTSQYNFGFGDNQRNDQESRQEEILEMRDIDVPFYLSFSAEDLIKLQKRKIDEVSKLDNRGSKNAARSRSKILYDLSAIAAAISLIGDRK